MSSEFIDEMFVSLIKKLYCVPPLTLPTLSVVAVPKLLFGNCSLRYVSLIVEPSDAD